MQLGRSFISSCRSHSQRALGTSWHGFSSVGGLASAVHQSMSDSERTSSPHARKLLNVINHDGHPSELRPAERALHSQLSEVFHSKGHTEGHRLADQHASHASDPGHQAMLGRVASIIKEHGGKWGR